MWRGFEDIQPELAVQKICNSHGATLEFPFYFPAMSSVHGVAVINCLAPIGSAVILRRLFSIALHVGEVLVHAVRADAMAEIQRAVLHQESFDRLPEPFAVADRFAVAAGAD